MGENRFSLTKCAPTIGAEMRDEIPASTTCFSTPGFWSPRRTNQAAVLSSLFAAHEKLWKRDGNGRGCAKQVHANQGRFNNSTTTLTVSRWPENHNSNLCSFSRVGMVTHANSRFFSTCHLVISISRGVTHENFKISHFQCVPNLAVVSAELHPLESRLISP